MIPRIRPDIEIHPLDTSSVSQKYLVITGDNKRFEISAYIYHLIKILDGNTTTEIAAEKLSTDTGKEITPEELEQIITQYLDKNGILFREDSEKNFNKTKSILYIRIPLFSAESIGYLTKIFQYLFVKPVLIFNLFWQFIFLFYFFFFFDKPLITLTSFSALDLVIIYLFLFTTTLFHELGHASSCRYFGANHGNIGIGLYLYFPVFYADVTDAWRLTRKQRVIVDIAGVYFQMLSLPVLILLYLSTYDVIYIKVIYFLSFSLVSTLNPFFRFDGYWLASDMSGIPNLRKRSSEAFSNILNKLLFKKNTKQFLFPDIKFKAKIFFLIYSVVSNLFFIVFFYFIIRSFPDLIKTYPQLLSDFFRSFIDCLFVGLNFKQLWSAFSALIFPTLLLVMLFIMIYSWIKKILNIFFKKNLAVQ